MTDRASTFLSLLAACLSLAVVTVAMYAQTPPSQKALSKDEVVKLLAGSVSPKRVAALATEHGIDFPITSETESELRSAGANDALIAVLRELAPKSPILVVTTTPSGAQVLVDDVPIARTNQEGRLEFSPAPGHHNLQVSMDGYYSQTQAIDLAAGTTRMIPVVLEPKPHATARKAPPVTVPSGSPLTFIGRLQTSELEGRAGSPIRGTLTIRDGRVTFMPMKSTKPRFDVAQNALVLEGQGGNTVNFHFPDQDAKQKNKASKAWFRVEGGKDSAANEESAKQLYEALKAGSQ